MVLGDGGAILYCVSSNGANSTLPGTKNIYLFPKNTVCFLSLFKKQALMHNNVPVQ